MAILFYLKVPLAGRLKKKKKNTSFWAAEEENLVISMSSCFSPVRLEHSLLARASQVV